MKAIGKMPELSSGASEEYEVLLMGHLERIFFSFGGLMDSRILGPIRFRKVVFFWITPCNDELFEGLNERIKHSLTMGRHHEIRNSVSNTQSRNKIFSLGPVKHSKEEKWASKETPKIPKILSFLYFS